MCYSNYFHVALLFGTEQVWEIEVLGLQLARVHGVCFEWEVEDVAVFAVAVVVDVVDSRRQA